MLPFRLLILSIAVHFLVLFFLSQIPTWAPLSQSETTEIEIVRIENLDDGPKKIVVRDTDIPDKLKLESNKRAQYLSLKRQRVKKQMQARNTGKTKNRKYSKKKATKKNRKRKPKLFDFGSEPVNQVAEKSLLENTPSTVGEYLPSTVDIGSVTSLNTDRFTYYSFYSRVEDLFRFRWETNLRRTAHYLAGRSFRGQYKDKWITRLRIFLDSTGRYKRSVILRTSGLKEIDAAAILAFQDAEFFPNPPQDLVKNGQIELNYQFVFNWQPSLWTQR